MKYAAILFLALVTGCVSITTPHVSTIQYDGGVMGKPVPVEGTITYASLFGVLPLGNGIDDYSTAHLIKVTCEKYGVDAIINTCIDTRVESVVGLFYHHEMSLTGLGVKLKKD